MDMDFDKNLDKARNFWNGIGNFFYSRNVWIVVAIVLIAFLAVWGYFLFCDDQKKCMDESGNKKHFVTYILSCILVLIGAILIGALVSKLLLFFITVIFWAVGAMVSFGAAFLMLGIFVVLGVAFLYLKLF